MLYRSTKLFSQKKPHQQSLKKNSKRTVSKATTTLSEVTERAKKEVEDIINSRSIKDVIDHLRSLPENEQNLHLTQLMRDELTRFRNTRVKVDDDYKNMTSVAELIKFDDELESYYTKTLSRVEKLDELTQHAPPDIDWQDVRNKYYQPYHQVDFFERVYKEEAALRSKFIAEESKIMKTEENNIIEWAIRMEESDKVTKKVMDGILDKLELEFEEVEDIVEGLHLHTVDEFAAKFPEIDAKIDQELRDWNFVTPDLLGTLGDDGSTA